MSQDSPHLPLFPETSAVPGKLQPDRPVGQAGPNAAGETPFFSELLILPDGRILAHNLTPYMAKVLGEMHLDGPGGKQRIPISIAPQ
jgi:hypothetical protein